MHLVRRHWSRRDFIRAAGIAGGAAALAPWLPSESRAATTGLKRLILVQTGNGSLLERWRANGSSAKLADGKALPPLAGPILAPLDAHRARLLLLDGIDIAAVYTGPTGKKAGANHGHAGASVLWTGVNGGGQSFPDDAGAYPKAPSLDQIINARIGGGRPSLQVSTWKRPVDPRNVYSYDESGTPLVAEPNPQVVFDDVFRDGFPTGNAAAQSNRKSERRKRSIELLRGELGRLKSEWPAGDLDRFDRHVEALDALEAQIAALANGPACKVGKENRPTVGESYKDDVRSTTDAQIDNIVYALACDRARVVSFTLAPENTWPSGSLLSFLPEWTASGAFKTEVHALSHYTNLEPEQAKREQAAKQMAAINRWYAEKLGHLLDRLTAAGVMDDTLVVWGTAMSHGGAHTNRNAPFVIAQGSAGPLATNRYLRWGNYEQPATEVCNGCSTGDPGLESNNNLLITLCHAFGLDDVATFGDPTKCRATGLDDRLMK
jgi:hypothetical protein